MVWSSGDLPVGDAEMRHMMLQLDRFVICRGEKWKGLLGIGAGGLEIGNVDGDVWRTRSGVWDGMVGEIEEWMMRYRLQMEVEGDGDREEVWNEVKIQGICFGNFTKFWLKNSLQVSQIHKTLQLSVTAPWVTASLNWKSSEASNKLLISPNSSKIFVYSTTTCQSFWSQKSVQFFQKFNTWPRLLFWSQDSSFTIGLQTHHKLHHFHHSWTSLSEAVWQSSKNPQNSSSTSISIDLPTISNQNLIQFPIKSP
jgi:hypothetical protein